MLPLDIAKTKVVDLSTLETGRFFFHEAGGSFHLGVALASDGRYFPWLNLSGPSTFLLESVASGYRKSVLALGIEPNAVRLRIENSAPDKFVEHTLGQVIFDSVNGPSIATRWSDQEAGIYQTTVALSSWSVLPLDTPRGGVVTKWALSFVDDSGQWVDLVSRRE